MSGLWLISYILLWLIVVVSGMVILVLAREIEDLHKHVDSIRPYMIKANLVNEPKTDQS